MEVTKEKVGPCEFVMTVAVEPERLTQPLRQAARRLGKRRPVPGFRPGKAPYEIAERVFGKEMIYDEMLNDLGDKLYQEALSEAQLEPYSKAKFAIQQLEPLTLRITVATQPLVTLGDYGTIRVKQAKVRVSKKDIDNVLEQMREDKAFWVPVERASKIADQIVIDALGTGEDGKQVKQSDLTLELTESLMPDAFRQNLQGIKPDESKEFDIQYPDDFRDSDLAGKTLHFNVTVKSVKEKELPPMDDALAQSLGEYKTVKDLREDIHQKLLEHREAEAKETTIDQALDALVDQATLEYPAVAVEHETSSMMRSVVDRLTEQGFTLEGYLNTTGRTLEQFREETTPQAEKRLRRSLALSKFAEAEGIKLEKADVDREVDQLSEGFGEKAEAARKALTSEVVLQSISGGLFSRKVLDHLLAIGTGQVRAGAAKQPEAKVAEASDAVAEETEGTATS